MPNEILPNTGMELPDVGLDDDTWGDIVVADYRILDNAITLGRLTKTLGAVDVTLTAAEAAKGIIELSGTLTANVAVVVPTSTVRLYLVKNGTTGAFSVTVKTSAGTGVTVAQGYNTLLYSDTTNVVQGATSLGGTYSAANATLSGTLNVAGATTLAATSVTTLAATGASTFAAGTAALPSITTAGDVNTGVFFPAADTVGVATAGSDRLRITSGGYFKASNTGNYIDASSTDRAASSNHLFVSNQADACVLATNTLAANASASAFGSIGPSGFTGDHFIAITVGTGTVCKILSNGNLQNLSNSYGAISDVKFKEGIVDSPDYLERFMKVRFRNYSLIGSDLKQFGVVAQELETVFPGLVDTAPDFERVTRTRTVDVPAVEEVYLEGFLVTPAQPATTREEKYTESVPTGTFTKSVKYSVLAAIQGKVIQELYARQKEQQAIIQDLMQRVAALESA